MAMDQMLFRARVTKALHNQKNEICNKVEEELKTILSLNHNVEISDDLLYSILARYVLESKKDNKND